MYNKLKEFQGKTYTGMEVGHAHSWNYKNGKWIETKQAPDRWTFQFSGAARSAEVSQPDVSIVISYGWIRIGKLSAIIIRNRNLIRSE